MNVSAAAGEVAASVAASEDAAAAGARAAVKKAVRRVRLRRAPLVADEALPALAHCPTAAEQLPPWPGRKVEIDGRSVYVRHTEGGPGSEPALYVHGLGGSSTNWTDLAGLLSPWLDGEAIDLPGYGRSDPPPDNDYSQESLARTVIRWIEVSGRGPVHLHGNSLGGAIAVRVAADRPDLVRTLTLVSPAMPPTALGPVQLAMLPLLALPSSSAMARRIMHGRAPEETVRGQLQLCFSSQGYSEQRLAESIEELREYQSVPWSAQAQVSSFQQLVSCYLASYAAEVATSVNLARRSLWRLATQVKVPTLVVWGWRDRLVNVRLAKPTAAAIPDSRLLVLPETGHLAQVERPRAVARAVVGLVRGVRPVVEPRPALVRGARLRPASA